MKDKKLYTEVRKLSTSTFREDGTLRSFKEQLFLWKRGKLKSGDLVIISIKTILPIIPKIKNLPLVIKQKVLQKIIYDKHEINYTYFLDLEELLINSPLAFESYRKPNTYIIMLNKKDANNNQLICIIEINKYKQQMFVNEINSIYTKDIQRLINKTEKAKKKIFINKKTKKMATREGLQIPKLSSHVNNSIT
ncbi:MAG: hypothetical protein LBB10_00455 [Bifidobacteriaceae bacterium]|jgi:hypothetical protein|nr:hypothetical protein [Bifidobacteriaceae bacterium]